MGNSVLPLGQMPAAASQVPSPSQGPCPRGLFLCGQVAPSCRERSPKAAPPSHWLVKALRGATCSVRAGQAATRARQVHPQAQKAAEQEPARLRQEQLQVATPAVLVTVLDPNAPLGL